MYIAYLWVDSWLKLMSACVEQMQPEAVAPGRNGRLAAGEIERLRAEHDGVLQALLAAHANELGELEQRMTTHRDALVEMRAAHTDELEQLRSKAGDAAAVAAEWARRYEQLRTETERLREAAAAASTVQENQTAARAAFEATIAALQSELSAARKELRAARQEMAAASAVVEDLRAQNETLRADVEKAIAAASADGERLRGTVAELRAQVQRETAAAEAVRQDNRLLTAELATRTEESKRLAAEMAKARARLDTPPPAGQAPTAASADEVPMAAKRGRRSAAPVAAAATSAVAAAEAAGGTLVAERPAVGQASAPALTVGFRKPEGWAEPLYVYYWATSPGVAEPGWPGAAMSAAGDGWWTCRIEGTAAADLLFNDHRGNQTGDLRRDRSGRLDWDGRWIDGDPLQPAR